MKHEFQKILEAELYRLNRMIKAETGHKNALSKLDTTLSREAEIRRLETRIHILNLTRTSVRHVISIYKKHM